MLFGTSCRGGCPCRDGHEAAREQHSAALVSIFEHQLSFLEHVHEFDTGERTLGGLRGSG